MINVYSVVFRAQNLNGVMVEKQVNILAETYTDAEIKLRKNAEGVFLNINIIKC